MHSIDSSSFPSQEQTTTFSNRDSHLLILIEQDIWNFSSVFWIINWHRCLANVNHAISDFTFEKKSILEKFCTLYTIASSHNVRKMYSQIKLLTSTCCCSEDSLFTWISESLRTFSRDEAANLGKNLHFKKRKNSMYSLSELPTWPQRAHMSKVEG